MQSYVDLLELKAHEEGGYFAVFYKSSDADLAEEHKSYEVD